MLAGTQPGDDLGDDDDEEEDEEASVTTDSTTLASDAAALASTLAQRSRPTEPAPRALERRTVFICTYSGHDGIYFSGLESDASRLAHVLATIRNPR